MGSGGCVGTGREWCLFVFIFFLWGTRPGDADADVHEEAMGSYTWVPGDGADSRGGGGRAAKGNETQTGTRGATGMLDYSFSPTQQTASIAIPARCPRWLWRPQRRIAVSPSHALGIAKARHRVIRRAGIARSGAIGGRRQARPHAASPTLVDAIMMWCRTPVLPAAHEPDRLCRALYNPPAAPLSAAGRFFGPCDREKAQRLPRLLELPCIPTNHGPA